MSYCVDARTSTGRMQQKDDMRRQHSFRQRKWDCVKGATSGCGGDAQSVHGRARSCLGVQGPQSTGVLRTNIMRRILGSMSMRRSIGTLGRHSNTAWSRTGQDLSWWGAQHVWRRRQCDIQMRVLHIKWRASIMKMDFKRSWGPSESYLKKNKKIMMTWMRTRHKEMIGVKFGQFRSRSGSLHNGMHLIRVLFMWYVDMGGCYFFCVKG